MSTYVDSCVDRCIGPLTNHKSDSKRLVRPFSTLSVSFAGLAWSMGVCLLFHSFLNHPFPPNHQI